MTGQAKLNAGDTAWTEQGQRVTIIDLTVSGAYLAAPMIEYGGSYDEPPTCEMGELQITEKLYSEPPRPLLDAEIAAAKQELEGLRDQLGDVRSEIREALAERTRLLTKLKDIPALQHIELMLEGKMRFVVIERYGEAKVMTIEEAQKTDGWRSERRLVTLTTSKEGVAWAINTYHDGSGSDQKIWFFETQEEAQAQAIDNTLFKLGEAYQRFRCDSNGRAYAGTIVLHANALKAAGGTLPADIAAAMNAITRENLRQTIENNEKHASSYNKAAEEARAQIAALDAEQAS